jgi:hypothetical protein
MNKIYYIATIAATVFIGPSAFAADPAEHEIHLKGHVNSSCVIPSAATLSGAALLSNASTTDSTVSFINFVGTNGQGISQSATLTFAGVWCNRPARLTLTSAQDGILSEEDPNPLSGDFAGAVAYGAQATWDGVTIDFDTADAGNSAFDDTAAPNSGDLIVAITTQPPANKLLVAGAYSDTLTVTLDPTP